MKQTYCLQSFVTLTSPTMFSQLSITLEFVIIGKRLLIVQNHWVVLQNIQ